MTDSAIRQYEPIFGEWKVTRKLGEGSVGQVYQIRREDEFGISSTSALKYISVPESQPGEEGAEHFAQQVISEFDLMSRLKGSSYIVSYEDHQIIRHENDGGWDILIRMEELTPLTEYIDHNPMTPATVLSMGIDICRGLVFCAQYGIVHRDIKPANIFYSPSGSFKLGDFGLSVITESAEKAAGRKGTFPYMAPEVYRGKPYTASADLYSLGLVMYKYLNQGRDAFLPAIPERLTEESGEEAFAQRIAGKELLPPIHGSEELKRIVLKACAFDPEDRYASAEEMLKDLEALSVQNPDSQQSASRRRRVVAFIAAIALLIAGGLYLSIPKEVTAIKGIKSEESIYIGETLAPNYTVEPERFADEVITFSSSDVEVFTVDEKGVITAVKPGTAYLTMYAKEFGREVSIKVLPKVTRISGIPARMTLEAGDSEELLPVLSPEEFAEEKITYESDDLFIAKVNRKGKVIARNAGTTRLTVSAGGCTAYIRLTVTEPEPEPAKAKKEESKGKDDSSNKSSEKSSGDSSKKSKKKNTASDGNVSSDDDE